MEALGSAGMSKKLKALNLETFSKETQPYFPEEKSTKFQHKQKTENVPWLCQAEKKTMFCCFKTSMFWFWLQNITVLVLVSKHQCFVFWLQNISVLVLVRRLTRLPKQKLNVRNRRFA